MSRRGSNPFAANVTLPSLFAKRGRSRKAGGGFDFWGLFRGLQLMTAEETISKPLDLIYPQVAKPPAAKDVEE